MIKKRQEKRLGLDKLSFYDEPIKFNSIIKEGGALHCVSSDKIGI